jgi:competence protein ComEA
VDLDTAPESLLITLPGIGPALAQRIVKDRERAGAFGALPALTRVAGIGEKTAARLAPHVTFSGTPRHPR